MNPLAAAQTIVGGLRSAGINLVATLPDINLETLLHEVENDRDIIHVPLCREEEGIGICAGAYLVGKKCAAIMQNGGFFNSNNAIVSTLLQYQIPLLLLIYYAGDIGDRTFSTTGSLTEPVLQALGIRAYIMRDPDDAQELIRRAQILTEDSKRPVALLLTKEALGRRAQLKSL
ncbi:MAG: sulfopyruvate decarboxylase [Deltaproteobacteria bacterium]|nr:MAG: sulfopyruvate decarboxylase [Deltaproteobacteria bacterium]